MLGQKATDWHDIVARVFRLKVQKLKNVKTKGKVFGDLQHHMYSIEWQKRGQPHVHILIWLKTKLWPNQINEFICTKILDPELYENLLLKTWFIVHVDLAIQRHPAWKMGNERKSSLNSC